MAGKEGLNALNGGQMSAEQRVANSLREKTEECQSRARLPETFNADGSMARTDCTYSVRFSEYNSWSPIISMDIEHRDDVENLFVVLITGHWGGGGRVLDPVSSELATAGGVSAYGESFYPVAAQTSGSLKFQTVQMERKAARDVIFVYKVQVLLPSARPWALVGSPRNGDPEFVVCGRSCYGFATAGAIRLHPYPQSRPSRSDEIQLLEQGPLVPLTLGDCTTDLMVRERRPGVTHGEALTRYQGDIERRAGSQLPLLGAALDELKAALNAGLERGTTYSSKTEQLISAHCGVGGCAEHAQGFVKEYAVATLRLMMHREASTNHDAHCDYHSGIVAARLDMQAGGDGGEGLDERTRRLAEVSVGRSESLRQQHARGDRKAKECRPLELHTDAGRMQEKIIPLRRRVNANEPGAAAELAALRQQAAEARHARQQRKREGQPDPHGAVDVIYEEQYLQSIATCPVRAAGWRGGVVRVGNEGGRGILARGKGGQGGGVKWEVEVGTRWW
jgi:hypothetical protein